MTTCVRGRRDQPGHTERQHQDHPLHRRSAIFFLTVALRPSAALAVTTTVAATLRRRRRARAAFLPIFTRIVLPPLPLALPIVAFTWSFRATFAGRTSFTTTLHDSLHFAR